MVMQFEKYSLMSFLDDKKRWNGITGEVKLLYINTDTVLDTKIWDLLSSYLILSVWILIVFTVNVS